MKTVKVGVCGLGTVGSGVVNILRRNIQLLKGRTGRDIELAQIGCRNLNPSCDTSDIPVTENIFDVANNPEIDIVVEVIGGCETARDLVTTAIRQGKHVVTANKALIAECGNEIFALAQKHKVIVAYEAGVAGAIPMIKSLREGLVGNRINWLAGIINGTGNFILTRMDEHGSCFEQVLTEAQNLGYAEADPTFDVEGVDAAHKLAILAANAFSTELMFAEVYREGISGITPEDLHYARELGYRIKHLGIARRTAHGVELRVHPALIPDTHLLAHVHGVMNSVLVDSCEAGQTMFYGQGAGSEPTASAIVADIADIARLLDVPSAAVPPLPYDAGDVALSAIPIDEVVAGCYLRIQVQDHPGVLMQITEIFGHHDVNIDALLQKASRGKDGGADIVILAHDIQEKVLRQVLRDITALQATIGCSRIRVESLA